MTAFQRSIICFGLIFSLFWFLRFPKPDMTLVYPDNCVFVLDGLFSKDMQYQIKDFIDQAYKKSKNPSRLLPKIEAKFAVIKSVIIDMNKPEVLNFTIQAYKPLFLLNNEHVICQGEQIFAKEVFDHTALQKLENVSFDGLPTPKNIERIIKFFELLIEPILQDFSIRWIDKHAIWLDQKEGQKLSLLVGYDVIPTAHDVALCRNLRGQMLDKPCQDKRRKSCHQETTWVCDVRFAQQVVLFSTNKGV